MNELDLFTAALAINDAQACAAFLDQHCQDDPQLRNRLEELLNAYRQADKVLPEVPAIDPNLTKLFADQEKNHLIGTMIAGKYKLLEEIGEGGMGTVFVAEQTEPVKRKVAIKLIKLGMDSKSVLARFEAERQALAMMDHPNIARVLDGGIDSPLSSGAKLVGGEGVHSTGRPYFVMEYIKGLPLTRYCDDAKLSIDERLQLFIQICQAVQHAHQKGIIHRDLKPGNILIALYDGKPVPKVIDFGLAKALHQSLTERTLHTGHEMVLGTPLYMSPEQAELNNLDIDTRSDIYSLGVILYELLTGVTPLEKQRFKEAAWAEVLRIIKEEEPSKPSTKLSQSNSLPSVAAQRQMEPKKLSTLLKGDLDWIVMKALEKDRNRRYETANGFAADVMRYLSGEAVTAAPPSRGYRFKKFVKRNKGPVVAAGLVAFALFVGVIGTALGWYEAKHQERMALNSREAEAEQRRLAEGLHALAEARKVRAQFNEQKAIDAAASEKTAKEQAQRRLTQIEKANDILGSIFENLDPKEIARNERPLQAILVEKLDKAVTQLEGEAIGDPHVVAAMQNKFGVSLLNLGEPAKAVILLERSLEGRKKHLGSNHPDTLIGMNDLALGYMNAGQLDKAVPLHQEALRLTNAKFGIESPESLRIMNNLAISYQHAGRLDLALPLLEKALPLAKKVLDPTNDLSLAIMNNLATAYQESGKPDLAITLFEESVRLERIKNGPEHPNALLSQSNLGAAYVEAGKLAEGIALLEQTRDAQVKRLGSEHHLTISTLNHLGGAYSDAGRSAEAEQATEQVLITRRKKLGKDHPDTIVAINNMAAMWWQAGRLDKSIPLFEEGLKLQEVKLGRQHQDTQWTVANLGINYKDAGRFADAIPLLEEAHRASRKNLALLWTIPQLMDAYLKAGKQSEAAHLSKGEVIVARKLLPPDNLDRAMVLAGAGLTLLKCTESQQAEAILRESLSIYERRTPDHFRTFNVKSLLGEALLGQKKYAEAEPFLLAGYEGLKQRKKTIPQQGKIRLTEALDRLIQLYTETSKPDDVKKWQAEKAKYNLHDLQELAARYQQQQQSQQQTPPADQELDKAEELIKAGKYAEAVKVLGELHQERSRKYGTEHPLTTSALHRLGVACLGLGDFPTALKHLETAVNSMRKIFGLDHHATVEATIDLAKAYQALGRFDQAIKLLEEALARSTTHWGKDHPVTRKVMFSLGEAYLDARKLNQAIAMLEELRKILQSILGPDHGELVKVNVLLARAYLASGNVATAEILLQDSYGKLLKQAPQHWSTYHAQSLLGASLMNQKKYADAERHLLEGYQGMKLQASSISAVEQLRLPESLDRLIQFYTESNKPDEVKKWQAEKAKYPVAPVQPPPGVVK